jgi:hypothetical protein
MNTQLVRPFRIWPFEYSKYDEPLKWRAVAPCTDMPPSCALRPSDIDWSEKGVRFS